MEPRNFILLTTVFHVTNVNTKTENKGRDEKQLRADIDGHIIIPTTLLPELALSDDNDYQDFLFNEDGEPKKLSRSITDKAEFNDHPFTLSLHQNPKKSERFTSKKIGKFRIEPDHSSHVKLHFQIQVHLNDADATWRLLQSQLKSHYLTVSAPPHQSAIPAGDSANDEGGQAELEDQSA